MSPNPLLSMVADEVVRLQRKEALVARVASFHGEHDQESHGNRGGGSDLVEGATVQHRDGSISGVVSSSGGEGKRVRVLWEDGSVSDMERDDLVVMAEA